VQAIAAAVRAARRKDAEAAAAAEETHA